MFSKMLTRNAASFDGERQTMGAICRQAPAPPRCPPQLAVGSNDPATGRSPDSSNSQGDCQSCLFLLPRNQDFQWSLKDASCSMPTYRCGGSVGFKPTSRHLLRCVL